MSSATRSNILKAARRLFNEQGFEQVTMRKIASEAGVGVGNVTYYFPRRQDIVTALMDDSFARTRLQTHAATPAQLTQMFSLMLDTLERDSFFFLDPVFMNHGFHESHHLQLRACLSDAMTELTERGIFVPAFTPEIRETLLTMLLMTHISWLSRHVRSAIPGPDKQELLRMHWVVLAPYLSPEGRAMLERGE
ncbi:MAG: TetR/AcrR family transcriptional regulator [Clostridia bacterium]|nr:TetR/AcrR family transcriptional regulator [Clostridia bacterium]